MKLGRVRGEISFQERATDVVFLGYSLEHANRPCTFHAHGYVDFAALRGTRRGEYASEELRPANPRRAVCRSDRELAGSDKFRRVCRKPERARRNRLRVHPLQP
jgi:hypothetical protein